MAKKKASSPYNSTWLIGVIIVALIGGGYLSMDGCNGEEQTKNKKEEKFGLGGK